MLALAKKSPVTIAHDAPKDAFLKSELTTGIMTGRGSHGGHPCRFGRGVPAPRSCSGVEEVKKGVGVTWAFYKGPLDLRRGGERMRSQSTLKNLRFLRAMFPSRRDRMP
jgi:hypothetical protein